MTSRDGTLSNLGAAALLALLAASIAACSNEAHDRPAGTGAVGADAGAGGDDGEGGAVSSSGGGEHGPGGTGGAGGEDAVCVPSLENCVSEVDEDCDGETPACTGSVEFVAGYRDPADRAWIVDLDAFPRGGFVIAGRDISDDPNSDAAVSIVTAYDAEGSSQWTKVADPTLSAISADAQGNIVTLAARDGVIEKLDRAGELVEEQSIPGNWELAGLDSSANGELAVTLLAYPVTEWQGEGCPDHAEVGQVCTGIDQRAQGTLVKLDQSGNEVWRREMTSIQFTSAWDVALDDDGNVVTVGRFLQVVDLGEGLITSSSSQSSILWSLDANGEERFRTVLEEATVLDVVLDSRGDIVISGSFSGELTLGGEVLGGGTSFDHWMFVAKLDASGELRWAKTYEGKPKTFMESLHTSGKPDVLDLTVDAFDNIVVVGRFDGELGEFSAPRPKSAFIIKLDPKGESVWSKIFGTLSGASVSQVASDAAGNLFVGGAFRGETELGDGWTLSAEEESAYFAKLRP